jgi:hypothetical protein
VPRPRDTALAARPPPALYPRGRSRLRNERRRLGPYQLAIAEHGEVVGSIALRLGKHEIGHIGYWCAPGARGRGTSTRALRRLCRCALDELHLERLDLLTDIETSPPSASRRRSASSGRESCDRTCAIRTGTGGIPCSSRCCPGSSAATGPLPAGCRKQSTSRVPTDTGEAVKPPGAATKKKEPAESGWPS